MISRTTVVRDISDLPTYSKGPSNPLWWGTQLFMIIEGIGFVFSIAVYLYLFSHNDSWPIGPQLPRLWGTTLVIFLILSEIPNVLVKRLAVKKDLAGVRKGLLVMSTIGLIAILIRCFEISAINVRWDDNAYGSIVWFVISLHTLHIVTDVGETWVMTVLNFIGPVDMRRFSEVEDNQDYWHFVVGWWVVIYIIVYLVPRWFEVSPW